MTEIIKRKQIIEVKKEETKPAQRPLKLIPEDKQFFTEDNKPFSAAEKFANKPKTKQMPGPQIKIKTGSHGEMAIQLIQKFKKEKIKLKMIMSDIVKIIDGEPKILTEQEIAKILSSWDGIKLNTKQERYYFCNIESINGTIEVLKLILNPWKTNDGTEKAT